MSKPFGQVRIIGGQWRSRKLKFPQAKSLRPSPDAVRERLFNWLQYDIGGSRCLDLYAGSGAFGFEAASRGATLVTMVDSNPEVIKQLEKNCSLLQSQQSIEIVHRTVERYLESCQSSFDIIFMDPPFGPKDLTIACQALQASTAISPDTLIYIESARTKEPLPIASSWHIIRQKTQGLVQSTLIKTSKK